MARQARKLNFLVAEDICRDLENLVPPGKRSQVVNEALRKELELIRRQQAVEKLFSNTVAGRKLTNRQIVEALAEDRDSH